MLTTLFPGKDSTNAVDNISAENNLRSQERDFKSQLDLIRDRHQGPML